MKGYRFPFPSYNTLSSKYVFIGGNRLFHLNIHYDFNKNILNEI